MTDSLEHGFTNAIALAGRAFVAAKGKDPENEGVELAKYLRADRPLSRAERELLAELVLGQWGSCAGRRPVLAGSPIVIEPVKRLRELVAKGWPKEAAKVQVADEFSISLSSVEGYEKLVKEREQKIEQAKPAHKED